jgi:membrane fusion protein (multidrug efflux system)
MKIFVLAAGLFGLAWFLPMPAAAQPAPAVGFITAAQTPVYDESSYVGRIQSPQIVQLNARVTGYLVSQNFTDGDMVKKGQLLYVIEQGPYQAAVAQAQAMLEAAMAQARNANATLARASALLRTPAGQQSNVDSSKAAALSDAAQIDAAKAALQSAQINLGYTDITSPLDGQIGATTVNVGNVVGPTSGTLATIVAQDPMYVVFSLPVVDAQRLQPLRAAGGLDLLVRLPDGTLYGQTGKIDFVNNQVTADTDTLTWRGTIANPARAGLDGPTRQLTDGEFITAILRSRTPHDEIVLPRAAVITDQLGDYVLKLRANNTVVRQNVTLGAQTADSVQILQGVAAGDKIITDGIQRIHPGITVDPRPAAK